MRDETNDAGPMVVLTDKATKQPVAIAARKITQVLPQSTGGTWIDVGNGHGPVVEELSERVIELHRNALSPNKPKKETGNV